MDKENYLTPQQQVDMAGTFTTQPPPPPAQRDYLTLAEFLSEVRLSYSAYRTLREKGKTPKELRISRRTIRITRAAMEEWRHGNELAPGGQSTL